MIHLGFWDFALLILVSVQATGLAYLQSAKWKAFVTALPVPLTLAALAVGKPVDASNVIAVDVLLAYAYVVRGLHRRAKIPIVPAVAVSALGYCAAGAALRTIVPAGELSFWIACVLTWIVAGAVHHWMPRPEEPDHHHHLPPWLKFPAVAAVVFVLILLKRILGGFMTMFPMIGVFAAYEGRNRLGAFCRAFDAFAIAVVGFLAVVRLLQPTIGLAPALFSGWLVHVPVLWLLIREHRSIKAKPGPAASLKLVP